MPTISETRKFLEKYVKDEYQLHHAEMVAAVMKAVAEALSEPDPEKFYLTGLIHDWDFYSWPEEHPGRYDQLQSELGVDDQVIEAIKGHFGVESPRPTVLAKVLFACDELSGLLFAYMKMAGNYRDMKIKSIKKKIYKQPNFAAKIDRADVIKGIEEIAELGIAEDDFLTIIRDTLSKNFDD